MCARPLLMNFRPLAASALALVAAAIAGCGSSSTPRSSAVAGATTTTTTTATATTGATTTALPGQGKPPIVVGDENDTEQFVLGELYYEALQAQGFTVTINQNLGPTALRLQQLQNGGKGGGMDMYPEYLNVWNTQIAHDSHRFKTHRAAYDAAEHYAFLHGLDLLRPTPFSDTWGLAVTLAFAHQNHLRTIPQLADIASSLVVGGPPQFQSDQTSGLPAVEQAYGFSPVSYKSLEIGKQFTALDQGAVQAAYVNTTDGEFTTGNYRLLSDTKTVFGIGNVVPVVTVKALQEEGPAFEATINRVSALLTLPVIRELNAQVDLSGQTPAGVASRFLADHGLIPASSVITS